MLDRMGSPTAFVRGSTPRSLRRIFSGFRHRYATGGELADLLLGAKRMTQEYGSMQAGFFEGFREEDETVIPALTAFTDKLSAGFREECNSLLPSPRRGSACKRLNLFLRWMVRRDEVDPGGWDEVPASKLLVPLDVHMYRSSVALGLTRRKSADLRTALEVTEGFRRICPEDPVRYDFTLTRLGIGEGRQRRSRCTQ